MYELIILSILMRTPAHGYLIAKIINDMFGPYTRISNGRLYPLLAKLEEAHLIETYSEPRKVPKGARQLRNYTITETGRLRFHRLMMDTSSNPGEYQRIFWHKSIVLDFLRPDEQLYLVDHYINYCQAHILHVSTESEELEQEGKKFIRPHVLSAILNVMYHTSDHWQLELTWVKKLRDQVIARLEQPVTGSLQGER